MFSLIKNGFNIFFAWRSEESKGKNPLCSRTIWALIVAWFATVLAQYAGFQLTAEEQSAAVMAVGIIMRFVTRQPIGFYEDAGGSK